ncbi:MAG TPA: hypothetical protein VM512_01980 [Burkholderiaceae bacterium]|nr:hypothetical protein [Burkholderiaceae bacterium]
MNIYKLLLGVLITVFLVVAAPYGAVNLGLMAPMAEKAWLVLLVTAGGLIIKSLVGDVVAGEFLFYKFGYDNCVMTLGALLTALALQLVATVDLFPGLSNVAILSSLPAFSTDPVANRSTHLFTLLIFALLGTLLTGRIAAAIKHDNAKGKDFLSLLNSLVGLVLLGMYVLVLVTKG